MWTNGCQSLTFSTRVSIYNNFISEKHRWSPVFASTNKSVVDLSLPAKVLNLLLVNDIFRDFLKIKLNRTEFSLVQFKIVRKLNDQN